MVNKINSSVLEEANKQNITSIKHKDSNIVFNKSNWKIKQEDRSKGRMKLVIKLSKEEAEAVDNFKKVVLPEGQAKLKEEDFLKTVFLLGIEFLQIRLNEAMVNHIEKNKAEFEGKGFVFDENGKIVSGPQNLKELMPSDGSMNLINQEVTPNS